MKRLLLSGVLSCLIIGTVLLRCPVPQSSAETVIESAALETRTDTAEAEKYMIQFREPEEISREEVEADMGFTIYCGI